MADVVDFMFDLFFIVFTFWAIVGLCGICIILIKEVIQEFW